LGVLGRFDDVIIRVIPGENVRRRYRLEALMRVAYVCREFAADRLTGPGAQFFAAAGALARAGHDVHLVSEPSRRPDPGRFSPAARRGGCASNRPGHVITTSPNARRTPTGSTTRCAGCTATARWTPWSSVLRAKRLLGEFPATTVVVTLSPWATADQGPEAYRPVSFDALIAGFAERYCREHADLVVTASALVAGDDGRPVTLRPPPHPGLARRGSGEHPPQADRTRATPVTAASGDRDAEAGAAERPPADPPRSPRPTRRLRPS
jgi:hypothetical protein